MQTDGTEGIITRNEQAGVPYTAETYSVTSGESGWCVKLGDDTVCDVYTGGQTMAERIAALLNSAGDIPTFAFQAPNAQCTGFSFPILRETIRDAIQQYYDHDEEGIHQSIGLLEMNVSLLSGEG